MFYWSRQVLKNGKWEVHEPNSFKIDCWATWTYEMVVPGGIRGKACDKVSAELTDEGLLLVFKNVWMNDGQKFVGPPSNSYPNVIFTIESKQWLPLDKVITPGNAYCFKSDAATSVSPTPTDFQDPCEGLSEWSEWSSCRLA